METFFRYAIRQKSTGYFLPDHSANRRGYTHDQPLPAEHCKYGIRLFPSRRAASIALTVYLKGAYTWREYGSGFDPYDIDVRLEPVPQSNRKADDFEVVEYKLEFTHTSWSKA